MNDTERRIYRQAILDVWNVVWLGWLTFFAGSWARDGWRAGEWAMVFVVGAFAAFAALWFVAAAVELAANLTGSRALRRWL